METAEGTTGRACSGVERRSAAGEEVGMGTMGRACVGGADREGGAAGEDEPMEAAAEFTALVEQVRGEGCLVPWNGWARWNAACTDGSRRCGKWKGSEASMADWAGEEGTGSPLS